MFNNTLRRVGDYCTVRHWIGGGGTFGWLSAFEDQTCHWSSNRSRLPPPSDQGQEAYSELRGGAAIVPRRFVWRDRLPE